MEIEELLGGLLGRRRSGPDMDSLMGLLALAAAGKEGGPFGGLKKDVKADDVMSTELLMATAKIAGQKAETNHLGNIVSSLRGMIDEMAEKNKAEVERLTTMYQRDMEHLQEMTNRSRQAYYELNEELQAALEKIRTVQAIIAANNGNRPSRGLLKTLREELGMAESDQLAASAAEAGEAETAKG